MYCTTFRRELLRYHLHSVIFANNTTNVAVEGKLNELLDAEGGISKRRVSCNIALLLKSINFYTSISYAIRLRHHILFLSKGICFFFWFVGLCTFT